VVTTVAAIRRSSATTAVAIGRSRRQSMPSPTGEAAHVSDLLLWTTGKRSWRRGGPPRGTPEGQALRPGDPPRAKACCCGQGIAKACSFEGASPKGGSGRRSARMPSPGFTVEIRDQSQWCGRGWAPSTRWRRWPRCTTRQPSSCATTTSPPTFPPTSVLRSIPPSTLAAEDVNYIG
jgi:hypothetical protein